MNLAEGALCAGCTTPGGQLVPTGSLCMVSQDRGRTGAISTMAYTNRFGDAATKLKRMVSADRSAMRPMEAAPLPFPFQLHVHYMLQPCE